MARIDLIKEFGKEDAETFNKISKGYEKGIVDGAREFAEWLCNNADLSRIFTTGFGNGYAVWNREEIISVDEAIVRWQKEGQNAKDK